MKNNFTDIFWNIKMRSQEPRIAIINKRTEEYNENYKKIMNLKKTTKEFHNEECDDVNINEYIFFNYNNNSCQIDYFLFIWKYVIFNKFNISQINKWNIDKNLISFLKDVVSKTYVSILNKGIWPYIINNNNYSNNILCPNKNLMHQSSCCSLLNKFKNNKEFCITYKNLSITIYSIMILYLMKKFFLQFFQQIMKIFNQVI